VFPPGAQGYVVIPTVLDTTPGGMNSVAFWFYRSGPVGNVNDVLLSLPNYPVYDLWLTYAAPHETNRPDLGSGRLDPRLRLPKGG
jgi:hypothetical protein